MLRARGGGWGPVFVSLWADWGPVGVRGGQWRGERTGKVSGYFLLLSFCLAHWWAGVAMIRLGKGDEGGGAANTNCKFWSALNLKMKKYWRHGGYLASFIYQHQLTIKQIQQIIFNLCWAHYYLKLISFYTIIFEIRGFDMHHFYLA